MVTSSTEMCDVLPGICGPRRTLFKDLSLQPGVSVLFYLVTLNNYISGKQNHGQRQNRVQIFIQWVSVGPLLTVYRSTVCYIFTNGAIGDRS